MQLPSDNPFSAWLRRRYPQRSFLDFDEVAANRHGELTPSQRSSLNWKLAIESLTAVLYMLLGVGLPLYVGVALAWTTPAGASSSAYIWGMILTVGAGLLGLPGIINAIRLGRRFMSARREIADRDIRDSIGTVVWSGDIYTAVADGHRLRPIYNKLNLPPATQYRFFYLRHSRWLLSAERLSNATKPEARKVLLDTLAATNHFRMSDLKLNRAGRMTTKQRWRLGWRLLIRLLGIIPLSVIVVPIILSGPLNIEDPLFRLIIQGFVFAFVSQVLGVFALAIDILRGRVSQIEGAGQRQKPQRRGDSHKYLFDRLRFEVSGQAYNALIVGMHYRVYYSPFSKTLLSIESLNQQ